MEDISLDALKLNEKDTIRVTEANLRETTVAIFEKMGVPKTTADWRRMSWLPPTCAVWPATACQHSSKDMWVYKDKLVNPTPEWKILRECQPLPALTPTASGDNHCPKSDANRH